MAVKTSMSQQETALQSRPKVDDNVFLYWPVSTRKPGGVMRSFVGDIDKMLCSHDTMAHRTSSARRASYNVSKLAS